MQLRWPWVIVLLSVALFAASCAEEEQKEQKLEITTATQQTPADSKLSVPKDVPDIIPPEVEIKEFEVVIDHSGYEPSTITVKQGSVVVLKAISNQVSHRHGITIDEYGINEAVMTSDNKNPQLVVFTADKPGEFVIYCRTCWDGPFGKNHPNIRAALIVK